MIRSIGAVASVVMLLACLIVPTPAPTQAVREVAPIPETGYVSDSRYINAFFGFLLTLPQDGDFRDLVLPSLGSSHSIFGIQAQRNGLTALRVGATQSTGTPTDDARKAAAGPKKAPVKKVEIGGREFWRSETKDESRAGVMHTLIYATVMNGYTVQFVVASFDGKLAKELEHNIESITFIDPAQVKVLAGSNARLFPVKTGNTSGAPVAPTHIAQLSPGFVSGNAYTNDTLGFSFQFPAGWIVADKSTLDKVVETGHQFAYGSDPAAAREHEVASECGRIILSATQYPEGTKIEGVNPLVGIMALDSDCLPGMHLPSSINDQQVLRQLGVQMSRALSGTPFFGKGENTLRAFMLENRMMLDLSSAFKANVPNKKEPLDVFTSIIFTEDNNYWVAWLFMHGSQSGLDDLRREIRIAFAPPATATGQNKTN
jgi:hypothetical protein